MLYTQGRGTTRATGTLPCTLIFRASVWNLSSRQSLQCEIVILIREMHPNVASDGNAQNMEVVCLCVPNLPMATEAAWLHAKQCKVCCHCLYQQSCLRQEMLLLAK